MPQIIGTIHYLSFCDRLVSLSIWFIHVVAYARISFLRLLVCFLWGFLLLQSTSNDYEILVNLPSKWMQSLATSHYCTAATVAATITSPLHFCNLVPIFCFQRSIYSNLLKIMSPLCSKSCSLSSFCLERKPKSTPKPARPRKPASLLSPAFPPTAFPAYPPLHPHRACFLVPPWTGRQDLTAVPVPWRLSSRYLCTLTLLFSLSVLSNVSLKSSNLIMLLKIQPTLPHTLPYPLHHSFSPLTVSGF